MSNNKFITVDEPTDIVERLRKSADWLVSCACGNIPDDARDWIEAADEIERLRGKETAIEALIIGSYVNETAHNILLKHTGMEGGCPTINWYKLRDEIAAALESAIDDFRVLSSKPRPLGEEGHPDQKEIALLRIIEAMGGETDSSESKWSWLNWFCNDERPGEEDDTFNRCNNKGWLHTTHDSDADCSTSVLTAAGRGALSQETAI